MKIDRNELVCGVRPALLKKLFYRDVFDTLTAMRDLGLVEPEASQTLVALERDDWIGYDGCVDYVDRWRTRQKAHRLCAARLIKRFPVPEGRRIAAQVVEEAREINRDPQSSHRVTTITLFGSVLTGGDKDDAGDIDLVIDVQRRILAKEQMKRIKLAEEAAMPASLDFMQRLRRVEMQILRRLKKVSNRISVHPHSDLEAFGAPHRLLYAYDIKRERELPADTAVRQLAKSAEEVETRKAAGAAAREAPTFRSEWPVAPNHPVAITFVELGKLLKAQHMWIRNAPLSDIARATSISEEAVLAYLASRRTEQTSAVPFRVNLAAMIGATSERGSRYPIVTRVLIRSGNDFCVKTEIRDPDSFAQLANLRRLAPSTQVFHGRCDLLPLIEPANAAAWAWYQKMRPGLKGFAVDLCVVSKPGANDVPAHETRPIDFKPLRQPMLDLLAKLLPVPRSRFEAFAHRIELCFGETIAINYRVGRGSKREAMVRRITKAEAGEFWEMAREFNDRGAKALGIARQWTLHVDGYALPDHGMTPGEIIGD